MTRRAIYLSAWLAALAGSWGGVDVHAQSPERRHALVELAGAELQPGVVLDPVLDAPRRVSRARGSTCSERAQQLYFSRSWQILVEELRFSSEPLTPFSILGLLL